LAEQKVAGQPVSEEKVSGLKIFLRAGWRPGDLVRVRAG
jgi:hypothetical protein